MMKIENQSMNAAMRHICQREGNTASIVIENNTWDFRLNFLGAVLECRDEKICRKWRPVASILAYIDSKADVWTINRQATLMWNDIELVEDYSSEKFDEVIKELDRQLIPWRYAMVRWLVGGDEASEEAREAALAEVFEIDYDDNARVVLRYCLDYLEDGGKSDDILPLHLMEVA